MAFRNTTFTAPLQTEISTRKSVNFGIKSSSPRASVISIPELLTYALYFVIAFVLEVSISCYNIVACIADYKLLVQIGKP